MDIGSQNQHFRWLTILAIFFCAGHLYAVTDLPETAYGPSKGRIPVSYYDKIRVNLGNKTLVKEWAELSIGHFLDDDCPLPKNIAGSHRDGNGNEFPALYKSHEGGDDLMWALLQIYKTYPEDADELRTATTGSASFIGSTTENSWQLSKLEENKEYFWAVDAVGENGIRKGEINRVLIEDVLGMKPVFGIKLSVEQLTSGTKHHFFGYIGQCQTIPWNASGRYVLGLEIDRIDRLPTPEVFATVILVDTHHDNKIIRLDKCHAWNPQQGTMFYWNPLKPETQFFFNDRDIKTGKVFTVLYDIEKKKRVHEYKFDDTPIGNSGVAADGSAFLAINYGRLARLRLVTGYPEALDWSKDEIAPENDGIFIVDIKTGKKRLLVSYRQLEKELKKRKPKLDHKGLFINHTLWNRDSNCVYFFVRGGWSKKDRKKGYDRGDKVNTPCSINADGTGLTLHEQFIGGHPEWDENNILIGREGDKQILYDMEKKKIVGQIGTPEMFPKPEGDISLSPGGDWFVNGYGDKKTNKNYYAVYRRSDGAFVRSKGIDKGEYSGNIRIDAAPRWNRTNDAILIPGLAENKTRQMFILHVITPEK